MGEKCERGRVRKGKEEGGGGGREGVRGCDKRVENKLSQASVF